MLQSQGEVIVAWDQLSGRCKKCKARLAYSKGIRLSMWVEMLKSFRRRHRYCGKEPKS